MSDRPRQLAAAACWQACRFPCLAGIQKQKGEAVLQVQTYSYSTQRGDNRQADFDPARFFQRFQDAAMSSLFDELEGSFSEMEANMRKPFRHVGMHICMYKVPCACCLAMFFVSGARNHRHRAAWCDICLLTAWLNSCAMRLETLT